MATGYYLTIKATESNINVNNNTSVVNVVVTAHRPSNSTGGWTSGNTPLVINCDGQTRNITVGSYDFRNYASKEIGNASFTITHNADGSKSVSISGDWTSGSSAVLGTSETQHVTGSTTLKLTTIPRASSITLDKNSATYRETLKITINRASSSFKHMLQVICNGDSPTPIAENVDTSYNYTIPEWIATRLIQQNNKLVIRCITYNNDTELGYVNSNDVIITTPSSFKPTITFSSSDSKKLDEVFGGYVKSQSEVTVKSTASLKQGAYVVTHSLTNGSQNASNQAWENTITTTSDLKEWTATVKDSRGLSTTEKYKPTTYDWYNPILSEVSANRCNSDKVENDEGAYINIKFNYDFANINNRNTKKIKIEYRPTGNSIWNTVFDGSASSYKGTYEKVTAANVDLTFEVQITIQDYFAETTYLINVPTASTLMDFGENGKSIAFGKVSSNENKVIEVEDGWEIRSESLTNQIVQGASELIGQAFNSRIKTGKKILWQSSPSTVGTQNITLNDSVNNYDEIYLIVVFNTSTPYQYEIKAINITGTSYLLGDTGIIIQVNENGYIFRRAFKPTNNVCQFFNCYRYKNYASSTSDVMNNHLLPRVIIGVKH